MTISRTSLYVSIHELTQHPLVLTSTHSLEKSTEDMELLRQSIKARGFRLGGHNCLTEPILINDQNQIVNGIRRWTILKQLDKEYPDQGFDQIWCGI